MATTSVTSDARTALFEGAVDLARSHAPLPGVTADQLALLVRAFFKHVPAEDLEDRTSQDLLGAVVSHAELAAQRPQGTALVRVVTPHAEADGWRAGARSVVEVITDDMPFLVDSVTMDLRRLDHTVHVVVHPQMKVTRSVTGDLRSACEPDADPADVVRESWMHVEVDRLDEEEAAEVTASLVQVLRDVREAVEDWDKMQARVLEIVDSLGSDPLPLSSTEVEEGREFLRWLADDHFTFLGYREYALVRDEDGDDLLRAVPGSGLGILRADQDMSSSFGKLSGAVRAKAREKTLLVLAKANSRATVHRSAYLDYVGVKVFDEAGEVVGERRFLGLFSSAAYTESVTRIPLLRERTRQVLAQAGFEARSHAGKALLDTLEHYPRDEMVHTGVDELAPIAMQVMTARTRRELRVFARRDTYGRYVSVLVYLPRDRYNTGVRERFAEILRTELGGAHVEFSARVDESVTASVHFVVHPPAGEHIPDIDVTRLETLFGEASRSWRDDFVAQALVRHAGQLSPQTAKAWADCFPEGYKEEFAPEIGVLDMERLNGVPGEDGIDLALFEPTGAHRGEARLKVFRVGPGVSLSHVLPMLASMGVEVVDERPYELVGLDRSCWIYEFGLRRPGGVPDERREDFVQALLATWTGGNEVDAFNQLVMAAGLGWRQVLVLRAYAKYLMQANAPFSLDSIGEALLGNVDIARGLVDLFEARFDPSVHGLEADSPARAARTAQVSEELAAALDDVSSLDHDRILRAYVTLIEATLRTNHFQRPDGQPHDYVALKLEPSAIDLLPAPRPRYEIFVHSPRVEGVHLRFGSVARGGLRWSDRRDDFRTEVLGLVKAQMVKNTVIVPVGAKGGFYCRQLPDPSDRDAWLTEGKACYTTFISGLLDVTDNLVDGVAVPPADVVRHDGDDTYLVVAADKGTASFSDLANSIAQRYGFWLGDAFASGGSVGYDHKGMGITARGAWVSVQRHFREMDVDCQSEDFTAVGIGDMSGDVFGNGMLCSEHTRLVAAFDHRDIFIDPDPDAASSYAERRRLFDLPRSSWQDYDAALISPGGGVWSRSAKSVPVSEQVRRALGLAEDVVALTPPDLIRAILLAPVDLLWNGGIGTYVKASTETNAEVGDKANDPIRVDGRDLRVRCVGEGGNLGATQLGRIEYAREGVDGQGGRLNTDFIDNSAGVDTSDHEVNIKILLDDAVKAGALDTPGRNTLLAEMTDEVAGLVLRDNYEQNLALANAYAHRASLLHVHEDWMRELERRGVVDRELEGLPDRREVRRRLDAGSGLTVPELSVLMAWTKIVLAEELLTSDLPDDPYLTSDLLAYFPTRMREAHVERMHAHPLRREIVVTQVVNDLVNGAGMTFWPRLGGETGAGPAELTLANFVAREIFAAEQVRNEIASYDNVVPAERQTRMRIEMRTLVERSSRWLVTHRRGPMDAAGTVAFFAERAQQVLDALPGILSGRDREAFEGRRRRLTDQGVPDALATRVAVLDPGYAALGIVETADEHDVSPVQVAEVHFALGERLGLSALMDRIFALPRDDRWQTMARAALRDDLYGVHQQLTAAVLRTTDAGLDASSRVERWEQAEVDVVARASATLHEIWRDDEADLARLSVGLRVVRTLLG
ncbi:MAG: NAD-glutamate dehydrogenase [Nocardioides sp.]|uniref:NAD-glutamate dehydrogenase n=1 Tax=Nocardioides sp. TaxID=35761 RepID=UPI003F0015B0